MRRSWETGRLWLGLKPCYIRVRMGGTRWIPRVMTGERASNTPKPSLIRPTRASPRRPPSLNLRLESSLQLLWTVTLDTTPALRPSKPQYHFAPSRDPRLIIVRLHDGPKALGLLSCLNSVYLSHAKCLFAQINLHPLHSYLSRWGEICPDPTNTHDYNAQTLYISYLTPISGADVLRVFSGVVLLLLDINLRTDFLPTVAWFFLRHQVAPLHLPSSEIFNFSCSFRFLEDLTLVSRAARAGRRHGTILWLHLG